MNNTTKKILEFILTLPIVLLFAVAYATLTAAFISLFIQFFFDFTIPFISTILVLSILWFIGLIIIKYFHNKNKYY